MRRPTWLAPLRRAIARARRVLIYAIRGELPTRARAWNASRIARRRNPEFSLGPGGRFNRGYLAWVRDHDTLDDADRVAIRAHIETFVAPPLISVVMPAHATAPELLRAAIASVRAQLYPRWELCVADDASPTGAVAAVLRQAAAEDPRIRWMRREVNGNISAATNSALALASGDFIALMDHDDLLPEHALYAVAAELQVHPDADLIYSDEDQIDDDDTRHTPYFKPDWSPELLLGQNMISHLGVYRRSAVDQVGGMRLGLEGSQDYDLALRVARVSTPQRIRHIPLILYHWRQGAAGSFSQTRLDTCVAAARRAIAGHLSALGVDATVEAAPLVPFWSRVRYALPRIPPKVSVIVPTRDRAALLAVCARGVLTVTRYPNLELLIIDNDSQEPATLALLARLRSDPRVRVVPFPGDFNFAALNNAAAREADGEILLLLNNDIEITDPAWLDELVSRVVQPGVAVVGAKLNYPNRTVQHCGVSLGLGHFEDGPGVAGHRAVGAHAGDPGYAGLLSIAHEVSAVTAACMAIRRDVFAAVGGLDEALPVAFNDVDLCLRVRALGWRIVVTPFACLIHHESASRGVDLAGRKAARFAGEARAMRERWGTVLDADPYFNPNLSRNPPGLGVAPPPPALKRWLPFRPA